MDGSMVAKSWSKVSAGAIPPSYKRVIDTAPYLERDEEYDLAVRWRDHGDKRAADRIVRAHLRLAIRMASKFFGYGLPIEDLVSEANIGLVKALGNFDPDLGFRFSTYSMWWIRASLNDYVIYNTSLVKIGTTHDQKRLFFRLRALKAKLGAYADGDMSAEMVRMLAANLKTDPQTVIELNARITGDASLNFSAEPGSPQMIDLLEGTELPQDIQYDRKRAADRHAEIIQIGMAEMSERERDVLSRRKLTESPFTLEQLGEIYGVSKERIRQIEAVAIRRLKHRIRAITPHFAD
jgi:RNA polymerase sigma-32 factor